MKRQRVLSRRTFDTIMNVGMAIIVIGSIIAATVFLVPYLIGGPENRAQATDAARSYAAQLYPGRASRVVCQPRDTDGNGYVSCTLVLDGMSDPLRIECADRLSLGNSGCRAARVTTDR